MRRLSRCKLLERKAIKPANLINDATVKPTWMENASAIKVPIMGEKIAARNCIIWAKDTKIALYSTGTVFINSSKKIKSSPAWKMPARPAKTAICQGTTVNEINNG